MMSRPAKRNRSKRALAGPLGFILGLALLCGLGGFFTLAHLFREDSAKLPTDIDRAREEHLPLSGAEIALLVQHPPDGENAALLYRKAMDLYKRDFGDPTNITFKDQLALAAIGIEGQNEMFRPIYQLIRRANTLPKCDFLLDYSKNYLSYTTPKARFPIEFGMKSLAGGIAMMGWADNRSRHPDQMIEEAETLIQMAKHAPEYELAHLGTWAEDAQSQARQLLMRTMQFHWREPETVKKIGAVADQVKLQDLYKLLLTEFATGLDAVHNIKSLEEIGLDKTTPKAFSKTVDTLYQSPAVREAFEEKFVHVYLEFFKRLPANHEDWPRIAKILTEIRKELNSDNSIDAGVARALTPTYSGEANSFGTGQAIQRLLQTSVVLCLEYDRIGSFPSTLPPGLACAVDPFGGKLLHYKPIKDGFTLYSVGRNLKDDGGRRWDPQHPGASDDIVFRLGSARLQGRIQGTIPRSSDGRAIFRRIANLGNAPR